MHIAVIGGGAAGFFSAIQAKRSFPNAQVSIFEKSNKVLSKVKVSGGGRCNVTNATYDAVELAQNYPRGERFLKKAFYQFAVQDTIGWFANEGVELETLSDGCIFPKSNRSQTIIDCFLNLTFRLGINVNLNKGLNRLIKMPSGQFELYFQDGSNLVVDRVIATTGGQPKPSGLSWLTELGIAVVNPVPSLFTLNIPEQTLHTLMGVVVETAQVKVAGTKLSERGILLVTHWGLSGPVVLRLSAWGARELEAKKYEVTVHVNWIGEHTEEEIRARFEHYFPKTCDKKLMNWNPFGLSNRLWTYLIDRTGLNLAELRVNQLGKNQKNKLISVLMADVYPVRGKTTFKEEFVTAGGIDLSGVDVKTMEAKKVPGLYFAGELMDIDGITGGFNFQAAWTTAFIAGSNVGKS